MLDYECVDVVFKSILADFDLSVFGDEIFSTQSPSLKFCTIKSMSFWCVLIIYIILIACFHGAAFGNLYIIFSP